VLRLFYDSLARFGVLGIDRELAPSDANAASYQPVFPQQPWYKRVE
jgi:chemotaxis protein methyltransferase CheR